MSRNSRPLAEAVAVPRWRPTLYVAAAAATFLFCQGVLAGGWAGSPPVAAEGSPLPVDDLLLRGTETFMNGHFDEAFRLFDDVIRREPANPAGYVMRGAAHWWLLARDPTVESHDHPFIEYMEEAIARAEAASAAHPEDVQVLAYLGAAYGFRARYEVLRQKWIAAAMDGKRAVKLLRRVVERDPQLYDAYLGLGMYEYYTSVLPRYVKLAQVLLLVPRGDRERGLQYLELARERGRLTKAEAQFFLVEIYVEYEKRVSDALLLTQDLCRRYPDNPYFALLEGVILVDHVGRYATAIKDLGNLAARAEAGQVAFSQDIALRARYFLGKAYLWKRDYAQALEIFALILDRNPTEPPWLVPWTQFRIGQAYDLQGKREKALIAYRQVLAGPKVGRIHENAWKMLEKPFTLD